MRWAFHSRLAKGRVARAHGGVWPAPSSGDRLPPDVGLANSEDGMKRIGVGLIGASTLHPGWALAAHVPALRALPQYELVAVSTSRRESAKAAAETLSVVSFDNHQELVTHPAVDLVVVTVKVPDHFEVVSAALAAGKNVYCEWPLGKGLAEAQELSDLANGAGRRTAVGLQARFSPVIRHVRALIEAGYIGDVLSTSMIGSAGAWGPQSDRGHAYMFDASNGATALSVSAMHALDALAFAVGDFATVSAHLGRGRKTVRIDDETSIPVTAPDQIAIVGQLTNDATVSVFYRGGVSRGENFYWEINGTEGDLLITSSNGNVQVAELTLRGGHGGDPGLANIAAPRDAYDSLAGPAANVARLYAQLARDIRDGFATTPDFTEGVRRHRLLAAVEEAAQMPVRVPLTARSASS
jgi:predicted dehydrogenase